MAARFLTTDSHEWTAILDSVDHDFSHLPAITQLSAREEKGEATAFFAEGDHAQLLIPLILRRVIDPVSLAPTEFLDVTSAYGYPSPLFLGRSALDEHFVEQGLHAFVVGLRERGIAAAFIRLHPLLDLPMDALARFGPLVYHGDTVSVDLTLPDEEIWENTSSFHRKSIHKAGQLGYVATMDAEWRHFDAFVAIYYETMARVGATDFYAFTPQYFGDLRAALGGCGHLCVVEFDDQVVAAGIVTEIRGIVQMFLAGSRSQFLRHSPAKVMENFVRFWAKARGNRWFHLGGGVGGANDSLFQFKLGFSPLTHPFFTWRLIADEDAYSQLVRQWEAAAGVPADGHEGFFPAYRKPQPL